LPGQDNRNKAMANATETLKMRLLGEAKVIGEPFGRGIHP
jgi:hypothetical protein